MFEVVKPLSVKAEETKSFRFTFPDRDWCTIAINETSGTLLIDSDYGHWGYTWGAGSNLGVPPPYRLSEAIVKRFDVHYVAGKLCAGANLVFDSTDTERAMRDEVLRRRRKKEITADQALMLWKEIEDINFDGEEEFYRSIPTGWGDDDVVWGMVRKTYSSAYLALVTRYIPALKKVLRESGDGRVAEDEGGRGRSGKEEASPG